MANKNIQTIIIAVIIIILGYFTFRYFKGPSDFAGPVAPENLNPGVKDYGSLEVEIFGKGNPLEGVEVDLGIIGAKGPESFTSLTTDAQGKVLFENVPVGTYDVFFNGYHFPKEYKIPEERIYVKITDGALAKERIDLELKVQ